MPPVLSTILYLVGHGTEVESQQHPLGLGLGHPCWGSLASQEWALGSRPGESTELQSLRTLRQLTSHPLQTEYRTHPHTHSTRPMACLTPGSRKPVGRAAVQPEFQHWGLSHPTY